MRKSVGTILKFDGQLVFISDDPKDHPVTLLGLLSHNIELYLSSDQVDGCEVTIDPQPATLNFSISDPGIENEKTPKKDFSDLNRYIYETDTSEIDIFARSYEEAVSIAKQMHNGYIMGFINAVATGKARLYLVKDGEKKLICPANLMI